MQACCAIQTAFKAPELCTWKPGRLFHSMKDDRLFCTP